MPALQQCDFSPSEDGQSTRSIDAVGSPYTTSLMNSLTTGPVLHLSPSTAGPDKYNNCNSINYRAPEFLRKGSLPATPRMQQMTSRNDAVQNHFVATTTTAPNGVGNIPLVAGEVKFAVSGLSCSQVDAINYRLARQAKQLNHGRIMTGNGNDLEDASGRRSVGIAEQVLSEAEERSVALQIPVPVEQCSLLTTDLPAEFAASSLSSRRSSMQSHYDCSQFVATSAAGTNCSGSRVLPVPYPMSRQSASVLTPTEPVDLMEQLGARQLHLTLPTSVAPDYNRQSTESPDRRNELDGANVPRQQSQSLTLSSSQLTTMRQLTQFEMAPNDVKGVAAGTYGTVDRTLTTHNNPPTSITDAHRPVLMTDDCTSAFCVCPQSNEQFDINRYALFLDSFKATMTPPIPGPISFPQQQQQQQQQQQPRGLFQQLTPSASSASGDLSDILSPSRWDHLSIYSTSPTTTTCSEDDTTSSSSFDRLTSSISNRAPSTASGARQRQSRVRRRSSAASSGKGQQQQPKVCDGCTTRRYNFERREGSNVDAPRNYRCPVEGCGKAYKKSSHLATHMFTHSDKKEFRCSEPDCSKSFRRSDELKRHLTSVHSTLKTHKCLLCDKSFARTDHLSQHKRIHRQSPQPSPSPTR